MEKRKPFARLQLLMIAGVVALTGTYLVARIYAASGTMTFVPSVSTVNIGDMVTVGIHENSGTDTVNAVQANVSYDATKLEYVGVSESGSAFPLVASSVTTAGSLQFARGTSGGAAPLAGDQLITTVTFKAIAPGAVSLTFAAGSALVRSTDAVDILAVKNTLNLTLADTAAPSVPTTLAAPAVTLTTIGLTWAAATDNVAATGYRIYRNGAQVGTSAATNYTDSSLAANTVYTYSVAAVDAAGNVSAQSTAITARTLADTTAPTIPGMPTSNTQTMTTITLGWTASTDNVAVASYRVFRNGVQIANPAVTASAPTYTDSGLAPNTSYAYTVVALDAANNVSAQSPSASLRTLADTLAPSVPLGLGGLVSGQNIALTWTAATDNVGVTSYRISRDGIQFATATVPNYTVVGALTGSHIYTVSAVDAAGNVSAQSAGVTIDIYVVGDINHDAKVDVFDLSTLLSNWGRTGINTSDLNGDSVVNVFDLSVFLSHWTG